MEAIGKIVVRLSPGAASRTTDPLPLAEDRSDLANLQQIMYRSLQYNLAGGSRVPRPREFDEDVALDAAMRLFWTDGFAATSVRDLGDAMGPGQASVYNAFGDKRALFIQCLDRYLDANMRARIARVERAAPPRKAIEAFVAEIGR